MFDTMKPMFDELTMVELEVEAAEFKLSEVKMKLAPMPGWILKQLGSGSCEDMTKVKEIRELAGQLSFVLQNDSPRHWENNGSQTRWTFGFKDLPDDVFDLSNNGNLYHHCGNSWKVFDPRSHSWGIEDGETHDDLFNFIKSSPRPREEVIAIVLLFTEYSGD